MPFFLRLYFFGTVQLFAGFINCYRRFFLIVNRSKNDAVVFTFVATITYKIHALLICLAYLLSCML